MSFKEKKGLYRNKLGGLVMWVGKLQWSFVSSMYVMFSCSFPSLKKDPELETKGGYFSSNSLMTLKVPVGEKTQISHMIFVPKFCKSFSLRLYFVLHVHFDSLESTTSILGSLEILNSL